MFWPSLQIIDLSVGGIHFGLLTASHTYIYNPHPLYFSRIFSDHCLQRRKSALIWVNNVSTTHEKRLLNPFVYSQLESFA